MRQLIPVLLALFLANPGFAEEEEEVAYENAYFEISPDIVSNLTDKKYILNPGPVNGRQFWVIKRGSCRRRSLCCNVYSLPYHPRN